MQTKGKFYIRAVLASPVSYYWQATARAWTDDPYKASFFKDEAAASQECETVADCEGEVLKATRDLT